jgi:uncharacterized membrane-anchored protein
MPAFWVLTTVGFLNSPCFAADNQIPNAAQIDWIAGPTTVSLGKFGEIKVPLGYQFTGAEGARAFLAEKKNAVPKDLVGCMISPAVTWPVLFEYSETGYLPDAQPSPLDKDGILNTFVQQYKGRHPEEFKNRTAPLSWQVPPSYDPVEHSLEWSIRAETGPKNEPSTTLNYNLELLGRHGVLHVTTIYQGITDLESLRKLAKSASFKAGERYSDHQQGDPAATLDLAGLVTQDTAQVIAEAGNGHYLRALLIGLAVLVGVGLGGILLVGKLRHGRVRPEARPTRRPTPAQPVPAAAQSASSPVATPQTVAKTLATPMPNTVSSTMLKPKRESSLPPAQPKPATRPVTPRRTQQQQQRRMMFDYNRYFSDLMSTVSNYASLPEPVQTNGHSVEAEQAAPAPAALPTNGHNHAPTDTALTAHAELIAHQITFIEEQRRLIQEQSKLIEEKSKLIAEKNHLLKLQGELIEQKLL